MTTYTVHERPGADPDTAVLVAEGHSWPAFVFTVFWAVWKGLWLVTAVLLSILILAAFVGRMLQVGDAPMGALQLAISLIMGFEGRNLQRWTLRRKGFDEVAVVSGRTLAEAELSYFCGETLAGRTLATRDGPFHSHEAVGEFGRN